MRGFLVVFLRPDHFHHFNQHSTERLSETASHAGVHLQRYRDFVFGEVHHVGHVPGEEAAVAV